MLPATGDVQIADLYFQRGLACHALAQAALATRGLAEADRHLRAAAEAIMMQSHTRSA